MVDSSHGDLGYLVAWAVDSYLDVPDYSGASEVGSFREDSYHGARDYPGASEAGSYRGARLGCAPEALGSCHDALGWTDACFDSCPDYWAAMVGSCLVDL